MAICIKGQVVVNHNYTIYKKKKKKKKKKIGTKYLRNIPILYITGYEQEEQESSLDNVDDTQTQLVVDQHLPSQESWNRLHEVCNLIKNLLPK